MSTPSRRLAQACVVLAAVHVAPAPACSCAPLPDARASAAASHQVFSGRAMAVVPGMHQDHGTRANTVRFRVAETFKGAPASRIEVVTALDSASCGYPFRQGRDYLVHTRKDEHGGPDRVDLCSRTAPLDEAGDDLATLRAAR